MRFGSGDAEVASRDAVVSAFGVSRETGERLAVLVEELRRWQKIKNLVGPGTLDTVWERHIADSLQLAQVASPALRWLDLGSGAGFPGLVLGILARDAGGHIDLVEANSRKCAFLRHAGRVTGAKVRVHDGRIEDVIDTFVGKIDVVTARALAPLPVLLGWCDPLLKTGVEAVFPKGQDWEAELTEARKSLRFDAEALASRTDPRGRILRIRRLANTDPT